MKIRKLSQLKIGALISYFTMGFSIFAGLVYTPWMVSKIGQADYGLYTLANSLIAIFMLDFGLSSAVSRFVSKYRAEGRTQDVNDILGIVYKLFIIIDLFILVVLFSVYFFIGDIYKELTPGELEKFRTLYIIVACYQIISFPFMPLTGILNAHEKFIQLKLCSLLYHVLNVVSVVVVLFFTNDVTAVIFVTVCSHLFVVATRFICVKRFTPVKVNLRASGKGMYKSLFSFTAWTTVINIMQRFTHSFAPSVLGITSGAIEIALYAPAITLEGHFYTLGEAVNGMFLPKVSRYIAEKKEDKIVDLMIKVGRYQSMVLGLVFIGFICIGKEFMILWMGKEYVKSYYLALIIIAPALVSATQQIAKTTVIAKKLIKYQAICMCFTGVFGLLLSYFLSKKIGATGVCTGTAVTSFMNIAFMNVIYKKKAGINVFKFYKKCYLRVIPCYIAVLLLGMTAVKFISINGWLGLAIKAGIVAFIFALIMALFYTTKEEKQMVLKKLKKS